jgi:hypothetical protein
MVPVVQFIQSDFASPSETLGQYRQRIAVPHPTAWWSRLVGDLVSQGRRLVVGGTRELLAITYEQNPTPKPGCCEASITYYESKGREAA